MSTEQCIKEWSDIQNIVVDNNYDKLSEELHSSESILKSKKYEIQFVVLDSRLIHKIRLLTSSIDIYYCVVHSLSSNVIYVLLSAGTVLTYADLYKTPEFIDEITLLAMKIVRLCSEGETVVIGGHSMGCVVSSYIGWKVYKINPTAFANNVRVIATAGAKWMTPEIYAEYSRLRHTKTSNKMLVDCRRILGGHTENDKQYPEMLGYPEMRLLYVDTEDGSAGIFNSDNVEQLKNEHNITTAYTEMGSNQCAKLHKWSYYMSILQEIYGSAVIEKYVRPQAD